MHDVGGDYLVLGCTAALGQAEANADHDGAADALDSLGYVAHCIGEDGQAVQHYRRAIALFQQLGNSYEEANTLEKLGESQYTLGRVADARLAWQQALHRYRDQHRAVEAAHIERELATLAPAEAGQP